MVTKTPQITPQKTNACKHIRQLISDLRSDKYLAIRLDEFVKIINDVAEISEEDVKACLKHDTTVKIINDVLWLWNDSYMYMLITDAINMARKHGGVLMEAEKYTTSK